MKINFVDSNCSMAFLLNFWAKRGVVNTKLAVNLMFKRLTTDSRTALLYSKKFPNSLIACV